MRSTAPGCAHSSMHEQASAPTSSSSPAPKKRLDTVVKLALSVFVGSFALIWGGMYLSRPDRSIPPYSVGSQNGHLVATHVPPATTDQQIETLLNRFRKVGHQTHDFGPMKIRPTTPEDPGGRYRQVLIYVFDDDGWTDPEVLAKYVAGDAAVAKEFEKSVRGYYWLRDQDEEGGIGPLPKPGMISDATRVLFKGRVTDPLPVETESEQDKSISPL
ncbi:hypothetical protein ACO9S2_07730 [Nitrospira sp. NS4]|uniref:hypothetical protein n=1 Tax=Nitrospira sp. NS4 TaxID=3414498 RepID=UPI003C2C4466